MSIGNWLMDLLKTAVADAILRRPLDVKVRRGNDGKVDLDVRMSPSNERPPQNIYYGYPGPPPHDPWGRTWPTQGQNSQPSKAEDGERFNMPREFRA